MIDEKTQLGNSNGNGLHPSDEPLTPLRSAEGLPTGIREGNAGLLSLKDLEAQLGDGSSGFYGRLRRFADVPGIGELLGAVNVPGAKGVRYEPRSVDIFRRLLAASTANEVTPATAVAWLKLNRDVQPGDQAETTIAEKTQPGNSAEMGFATRLLSGILSPLTAALNRLAPITPALDRLASLEALPDAMSEFAAAAREQRAAPPAPVEDRLLIEDRLLTAEQAAEMLACHPRSVSRYVTPVRPRTWRYSDCQRYIERLGEKLEDAQREAAK